LNTQGGRNLGKKKRRKKGHNEKGGVPTSPEGEKSFPRVVLGGKNKVFRPGGEEKEFGFPGEKKTPPKEKNLTPDSFL